jgi:hypothetical protein
VEAEVSYLTDFEAYAARRRAMANERLMAQGAAYRWADERVWQAELEAAMMAALNEFLHSRPDVRVRESRRRRLAARFVADVLSEVQ